MGENRLSEVLRDALEMEEKGHKFYVEAGQKNLNNITKKTFKFLADSEILHIETIKNFHNTLKEEGELPSIELSNIKNKRLEDLNIFSKNIASLKEKIKPNDDEGKILKFAMEFENNGYRYYENMLKQAKDEKLITFLKFLLQEESRHYDLLMNTHSYITDTHNWFMYEEDSFPQGG